jgi:hypothetical protein
MRIARVLAPIIPISGQPVHGVPARTPQLAGMRPSQQVPVLLTDPGGGATRTVPFTLGQLPGGGG